MQCASSRVFHVNRFASRNCAFQTSRQTYWGIPEWFWNVSWRTVVQIQRGYSNKWDLQYSHQRQKQYLVNSFFDLLDSLSLQQHVQVPTHKSGHTLDLIITRDNELSPLELPSTDTVVTDHFAISCHFCIKNRSKRLEK